MSRRTDTQPRRRLPDAAYGEQSAFQAIQAGAPMAGPNAGPAGAAATAPPGASPSPEPIEVIPFGAPTNMPEQPVTAGVDLGAGPGSAALGLLDEDAIRRRADMEALARYLPVLEFIANGPNGTRSMQDLVRKIKALAS